MTIPISTLLAVKDLIRRPASDTGVDEDLDSHYQDTLRDIFYKKDWLVQKSYIDVLPNQRTYQVPARMMRLLSVHYNGVALQKISARSLDYLHANWQSEAPGTPEEWWINQLPDPNIVPNEFGIHPVPATFLYRGLTVFQVTRPLNDNPIMLWIRPLLIYRTAASYLMDTHSHRDPQVGAFYQSVADLFDHVLSSRIQ